MKLASLAILFIPGQLIAQQLPQAVIQTSPPPIVAARSIQSLSTADVRITSGNTRYQKVKANPGELITLDAAAVANITANWVSFNPYPFEFAEWRVDGQKLYFAMPSHNVNVEIIATPKTGEAPPVRIRFIFEAIKASAVTVQPSIAQPVIQPATIIKTEPSVSVVQPVVPDPTTPTRTRITYRSVNRPQWYMRGVSMTRSNLITHLSGVHKFKRSQLEALNLSQLYALHDDDHNGKSTQPLSKNVNISVLSRNTNWQPSRGTTYRRGLFGRVIACPPGG